MSEAAGSEQREGRAEASKAWMFPTPVEDSGRAARPRRHHFLFAHRFLPRLWWNDGAQQVTAILAEDGAIGLTEMLHQSWHVIGDQLDDGEQLTDKGLKADCFDLVPGHRAVIVTLPRAKRPGEAVFAALAWRSPRRRFLILRECPIVRFFTVELRGVARSEQCEGREGCHAHGFAWAWSRGRPACSRKAVSMAPDAHFAPIEDSDRFIHGLYETSIEGIRLSYDEPPPATPADFHATIQHILKIGPS